MKTYLILLISLSVALATLEDLSIVNDDPAVCSSKLDVRVRGKGKGGTTGEARSNCKSDCEVGSDAFKSNNCRTLCGLTPLFKGPPATPVCTLCNGNQEEGVKHCGQFVDLLIGTCKFLCDQDSVTPNGIELIKEVSARRSEVIPGKLG
jgi:hypothetical protein